MDAASLLLNNNSGATLSLNRHYRYSLWRSWDINKPYVLFIGLNPSTADEHEDDPTIRRCIRFAADWGYGALFMANLFAIRATKPGDMTAHSEPVGEDNDSWLQELASRAGLIICAWGAHGKHLDRDARVRELLYEHDLKCLGLTKQGQPRHPLYIRADIEPETYCVNG